MLLHRFHPSNLGVHLEVTKTFYNICCHVYWLDLCAQVLFSMCSCQTCQQLRHSKNTQIRSQSVNVHTY